MAALRFFGSGSYQLDIGKNINMAVSQPTVSRCIHEIIDIITRPEILNEWIKFPNTLEELYHLRTQYESKFTLLTYQMLILCCYILQFLHNTIFIYFYLISDST